MAKDIALRGPELKKLVAMAKKKDLNFAYCPGNDPAEDVFVLDRKKNPEVIGRVARAEGTGTKLGFGTAKVKGKVMMMTCTRELPQLAKKLKKFLKSENIAMNIVVLDSSGKVLEEDIEDLGDEDDGLDSNEGNDAAEVEAESQDDQKDEDDGNDGNDAADDAARLEKLKMRAGALQKAILAAPAQAQAPLGKGLKGAVVALKDGKLDAADTMMGKLEDAVAKVADKGDAAKAPTEDPALAKLTQVSQSLSKRIDGLGAAEGATKLRAAHGLLDEQIAGKEIKKAAGTAKMLGDAIQRVEAVAASAGAADAKAEADAAIPKGVVQFAQARLDWIKTRTELRTEMKKLQGAIVAACDPQQFPTISQDTEQLFTYLDDLNEELEDALDALVKEPDGAKREAHKGNVEKIVTRFQSKLDTPFFQAVDGGNGFQVVNVRGAAIASLGKVSAVLKTAA